MQLNVPSVRLSPSLAEIQKAVNKVAQTVLWSTKSVWDWGQTNLPEDSKRSFFDRIGKDVQIVRSVLLLTGALHGSQKQVKEYLESFKMYDWLWKDEG